MASNPLTSTRKNTAPPEHPVMQHAKMWQHVGNMAPDDQADKTTELSYALPIMGALAWNPKTTRKDVIKAAADAAGAGKIPPTQAVSIISQMPDDPDKLQPWLQGMYKANLTALVHLKAAQMPGQAPQGAAPQAAQAPQGVPQQ